MKRKKSWVILFIALLLVFVGLKFVSQKDRKAIENLGEEALSITTSVVKSYEAGSNYKNESISANQATEIINGEIEAIKALQINFNESRSSDYQYAVQSMLEGIEEFSEAISKEDMELAKRIVQEQQENLSGFENELREEVGRETIRPWLYK